MTRVIVAGCAEDVEALLSALHQLHRDRQREIRHGFAIARLACIKFDIFAQETARNGIGNQRPSRSLIAEKIALRQRFVFWLIMHILAASGEKKKCEQ